MNPLLGYPSVSRLLYLWIAIYECVVSKNHLSSSVDYDIRDRVRLQMSIVLKRSHSIIPHIMEMGKMSQCWHFLRARYYRETRRVNLFLIT